MHRKLPTALYDTRLYKVLFHDFQAQPAADEAEYNAADNQNRRHPELEEIFSRGNEFLAVIRVGRPIFVRHEDQRNVAAEQPDAEKSVSDDVQLCALVVSLFYDQLRNQSGYKADRHGIPAHAREHQANAEQQAHNEYQTEMTHFGNKQHPRDTGDQWNDDTVQRHEYRNKSERHDDHRDDEDDGGENTDIDEIFTADAVLSWLIGHKASSERKILPAIHGNDGAYRVALQC